MLMTDINNCEWKNGGNKNEKDYWKNYAGLASP